MLCFRIHSSHARHEHLCFFDSSFCFYIDFVYKIQDYFKLTKDEFLESYSYLTEEDYNATTKALEKLGNISRIDILKEMLQQTEHNILCYSDSYLCTRPKKQYIKEWVKENKKADIIKSMIKDEKEKEKNKSKSKENIEREV